jgi:deoxyribonuclease IV
MLIGAHVSPAGGLAKAVERGVERGCRAIQIFNQSPRMWRPTSYGEDDFAAFRAAMIDSPIEAVMIHAVYLLNCASDDEDIRAKSVASLTHSLRVGDAIGAHCVVLHPGSALRGDVDEAIERAGWVIREALDMTDHCPLHLENTAGAGGTLGRSFGELYDVIERSGGDERIGICLDCCHLFASGFEIRTSEALAGVVDEFESKVGLGRLRALHINDSKMPFGSNRDRHADIGKGELGRAGIRTFLSEPRFESLPTLIETRAAATPGTGRREVRLAKRLRREGLEKRGIEVAV